MSPKFLLVCGLFVAGFLLENADAKCSGAKCEKVKAMLAKARADLLKKFTPAELKAAGEELAKKAKALKALGPEGLKELKQKMVAKGKAGLVKKFGSEKLQKIKAYLTSHYKPGDRKLILADIKKHGGIKGVAKLLKAQA